LLDPGHHLVARMYVTSDKMLHGFGSFPGSPWSLSTSKSTGLEPMPLFNQSYPAPSRITPRLFVTPMNKRWDDYRIEYRGVVRCAHNPALRISTTS
ncbi:MAG: hypothetical protein ABSA59_17855, partial [Terriglobia bacterium]